MFNVERTAREVAEFYGVILGQPAQYQGMGLSSVVATHG
jgi:hypothetical protein